MGYMHIENLYKEQTILMFRECYALEKIHGTSAHISWHHDSKSVTLFSGGESPVNFAKLFSIEELTQRFSESFPMSDVTIYGEAYGGKQQGQSYRYGKELKFIAFDVQVDEFWLDVPNAEQVSKRFDIEFVYYVKVSTDIESLNLQRDQPSVQASRNGCGMDKPREGVVLRPLIELKTNNGSRIMSKHKGPEERETKTQKEVSPEALKVLEDAKAIAEEWVTETRLLHVLDKLPAGINMESTRLVISAMLEDVYREGAGEIVESKEASRYIGSRTVELFKKKIQHDLEANNL